MLDILKKLREMQEVDGQLVSMEAEAKLLRQEIDRARLGAEKRKAEVEILRARHHEELLRAKNRELDHQTAEGRISKLKGQQSQVRTNKEFSAIAQEIQNLRADAEKIEEEVLKMFEAAELQEAAAKKAEAELAALQKEVEEACAGKLAAIQEMEGKVSGLRQESDRRCQGIEDPDVLRLYRQISAGREGVAVVPSIGGICQGCFMKLTSQTVNLLMQDKAIIRCPSCSRILYLEKAAEG